MGALTLHLARAIHGANPPVPPQLREALCTAQYEKYTLPRKVVTEDDALDYAHGPHALELSEPELASLHEKHMSSRRAILHTLDVNPTSSRVAHGLVRHFRRAQYLLDVDFHVSTIRSYLSSRLAQNGGEPFLSHVILDLPASQDHADTAVQALQLGGKMVVFYPSITQILDFVVWVKETNQPLALDRVVELQTSTSNGDVGFRDGLGGRHWDVKVVDIRKATNSGEKGVVCRPKVGTLVVGGGFLAVFSKMPRAVSAPSAMADEVEQPESKSETESQIHIEEEVLKSQ
ncbi:tRNA (adenine-N(1)-)-methyltransferase [Colletotrichum truncatum]|uniref:tRNA (Adenine-N(1)-)-methyltransferase n=1 Tax=Colletotrichum truncatum TaxID=5467 RepID=A0ACC3YM25_COLTU|nr:tRNA (adenine-N(1)-)-methyltransferase [Colletotrichum truncatum]KAF6791571.1 tRNA (adenine-N(1)-)-methyltransferase [Colletotrichum truncatum]